MPGDVPSRTPAAALPPALRRPLGVTAVVSVFVVALLGVLFSGDATAEGVDTWARSALGSDHPRVLDIALLIDFTGEPVGAVIMTVAVGSACLAAGHRRLVVLALLGPGCTVALTTALKPVADRTIHGSHLSYPSGHAAFATALGLVGALLLVHLLRATRRTALAPIVVVTVVTGGGMSWALVTLDAHYLTDTVGGVATALVVLPATAWALDRVLDRASERRGTPDRAIDG